jgi:OCT family organic cation transporter-like MFS transporter 4/5
MQFDEFYKTLGVFGPYQKVKYFLICLTYMFPPIMVYTWSFTAATPSFRCLTPSTNISGFSITDNMLHRHMPNESQCRLYQSKISIQECQRCFQVTDKSEEMIPCNNFIFDRTYYQSTLVEEWVMVCNRVSLKSFVQIVFFFGYMVGSLIFGVLSDK